MTHTGTWAVAAAVVLATSISGCSDGEAPIPTAPTPPPASPTLPPPSPPPSATLFTLSGEVFEVTSDGNRAPVEDVEVYCEPCGPPEGHSGRHTDAAGLYSFDGASGVHAGTIPLLLARRGYVLPNQRDLSGPNGNSWMGTVSVTLTGDTRFDIQIVRK